MATETAKAETIGDRRRKAWPVILLVIGYMIPLFWLWTQTGYPDDFGVHLTAHGRTGLLENWWYAYLLVQRYRPLDVVTFMSMWAAAVAIVGWLGHATIKDRRSKQVTDASHDATKKGDAA